MTPPVLDASFTATGSTGFLPLPEAVHGDALRAIEITMPS
ncbi:hypothetical protein Vid5_gp05 [Pantoea phage vB_PagS_Vid5]|uniref:Uncharacterized protein n=1 Tax=Pantoea phage vB_PagS_Vid5 TaxID=2099652 RepID=A0A2P1CKM7_9CAUD|nr:hypothetical protein FDJ45_gp005 [Pantoea phage vB_PagS_Vid5]AVJ51760.1 hypothetical protein Vid5_gp05 [Pantoea phage vB_PagS_Vid5]